MSESWASWPVDLRSCCAADAWARLYFPAVRILLREANLTTFTPRSRKCSCIILWNAQSGSFALRGPVYKGLRVFSGCCVFLNTILVGSKNHTTFPPRWSKSCMVAEGE
jgi:hypothetical protein